MRIDGRHQRTIWVGEDGRTVAIIDQTLLPHELRVVDLTRPRGGGRRDRDHAGARRAADRRHRRLRHVPGLRTMRRTRRWSGPMPG